MTERSYPAKLLLFGEYTVLSGSQALAVPLSPWSGRWMVSDTIGDITDLTAYVTWLRGQHLATSEISDRMLRQAREGWKFHSEIPIGYGLGSSGAFVAAMYDRYFKDEAAHLPGPLLYLFARMENYFHGASSGMDPMVSFSNEALYKNENGTYQSLQDPGWPEGYQVYLLDSGSGRHTGPLVDMYRDKLEQLKFQKDVARQLIPYVEHAIHFYLQREGTMLAQCLEVISRFQREYFAFLIPTDVQARWDDLLKVPGVYVKLCGAGGGGYFMVVDTQGHLDSDDPAYTCIFPA